MLRPNFNPTKKLEEIIRVNHAGEYGAKLIYQGQLDAINNLEAKKKIEHMYKQELVHLAYFEEKIKANKVRPTILMPIWTKLGYMMGYITAKMGDKYAMICTDNIEDVIEKHYQQQLDYLEQKHINDFENELKNNIEKFRQEEIEHQHIANQHNLASSVTTMMLSKIIRSICKTAILLSKRI